MNISCAIRSCEMPVKYQVDGDIFREITKKWLFAYVDEFRIVARVRETDHVGNLIEKFQLNDGRVFSRRIQTSRAGSREVIKNHITVPRFVTQNLK